MNKPRSVCESGASGKCVLGGVRTAVDYLVTREDEIGAPDDVRNGKLLALCEALETLCAHYETDVRVYEIFERLSVDAQSD